MARPRKNEHIKEQLLDVGLTTLLAKGYHGTGIKEILDQLGVPKGSFYHYFKSKEAFAAEVITYYAKDLNTRLMHQVSASACATSGINGLDALKLIFQMLVKEHSEGYKGCILGALASEIAESSDLCRAALRKEVTNWQSLLQSMIRHGQDQQVIRDDVDVSVLTRMVWNCWEGAVISVKIQDSLHVVEEVPDVMLDVMLAKR